MSDDTKTDRPGAKLERTDPVSARFNQNNELAEKYYNASPEARAKADEYIATRDERLEAEKKNQQRAHKFRVLRAENDLLKKYIGEQALRPESVRADPSTDLKIIEEQAEKMVSKREAFYQQNIERETEATIRHVLAKDQQGHSADQTQHAHEQEQEH
uniref:hypothetical protein n=1 Tax=Pararhizobium sp. IMCC3301 TaxID=3067904 RepID=UPI002741FCAD|nr:hypothetical protein [Pararhizobium sp. IMCC3301]